MTTRSIPELPAGRHIELAGRGTTFIREANGPEGAPTLLLLHGWTANADLNWRTAYPALRRSFNVIAPDLRGHDRGIRDGGTFRLEDCADDAAALIESLGVGPVIPVGYSMGGPVAQLLWQRHRHLVDGLVLCATSRTFNTTAREHALFTLLNGASAGARHLRDDHRAALAVRVLAKRRMQVPIPAHDWLAILDAGRALGRFDSRSWASTIDVPTSVLVTTRDHVVPAARQYELADAIPAATVHRVHADHAACVANAEAFVPELLSAIRSVTIRTRQPLLAA
jgi:3-oxoadipate enol-lactonase